MGDRYTAKVLDGTTWVARETKGSYYTKQWAVGDAPDEPTARRCAEAVVAVLEGRDPIAERDALRAELERWKRGICIEGDYITENGDVVDDPWAAAEKLRAELERVRMSLALLREAGRHYFAVRDGDDKHMSERMYIGLEKKFRALLTPEVPRG